MTPPAASRRFNWHTIVIVLLTVGLLWLFLRGINFREVLDAMKGARWSLVAGAVLVTLQTYVLRTWRWQALLQPLGGAAFRPAFRTTVIGFASSFLVSSRLGELDKSIEEAAMDLGANRVKVFFLITLPILPGGLTSAQLRRITHRHARHRTCSTPLRHLTVDKLTKPDGYYLTMVVLPNRNRLTERREATRREILDTAWEIARSDGLAALTLRAVAERIGMRSPSLYSHFDSKNAIYDAMFAEGWADLRSLTDRTLRRTSAPRRMLLQLAELFFDFATDDLARYQLMNQRTIPDFQPSEQGYAESLAAYDGMRSWLRDAGVTHATDLDLWTAVLGGFVDQQLANDPGGDRWRRQLVRLVDMYCTEVGVPGPQLRRTR